MLQTISSGRKDAQKKFPGTDVQTALEEFTEDKLEEDLKKTAKKTRKPRAIPDKEHRCIARVWGKDTGKNKDKDHGTGTLQCKKKWSDSESRLCKNHHCACDGANGKIWGWQVPNKSGKKGVEKGKKRKWFGTIEEDLCDFTVDKETLVEGKPVVVIRWPNGDIADTIKEKVQNGEWINHMDTSPPCPFCLGKNQGRRRSVVKKAKIKKAKVKKAKKLVVKTW